MEQRVQDVDVADLIDRSRIGGLQLTVLALGLLGMILEGYDTYVVGYVGPQIASFWGVPPSELGVLFTAGVAGSAAAYLCVGFVSERIGRRRLVVGGTVAFGVATLLSMTAGGAGTFIAWRVVSGLALGVVLPSLVATVTEFAPRRRKSLAVVILYSGFAIGSALGGVLAARLVPAFGWKSVFVFGGAAPILLGAAMALLMPESPQILCLTRPHDPRLRKILMRLSAAAGLPKTANFVVAGETTSRRPIGDLFRHGSRAATLLIWLILAMDSAVIGSLVFWIPTLMARTGLPPSVGISFTVTMLIGGIFGAYLLGYAMDRFGSFVVLVPAHLCAAVAVLVMAATLRTPVIAVAAVIGLTLNGGVSGVQGVLARLYPTAIRTTGIGWASGMARFVGMGQPLITGLLLAARWSPSATLFACGAPVLISAAALLVLSRTPAGADTARAA